MPTLWIVPHTHWDREWYQPAARFQVRLARLIDDVLERLGTPSLPAFLLDGQAVVLDDYLGLRPEARVRLGRALRGGKLQAGPWYVLPDELLVSAEALIRNLLTGTSTLRRFHAPAPRVGYSPDAFGHTGALPRILNGFGIGNAIVWRGFAGAVDLHRWRSADGSEVLMIHLPQPGYEYGGNLPRDAKTAARRWRELRALLGARARTEHWLVLNGADHHAPQADLAPAVRALRAASRATVRVATLGAYVDAVTRASRRLDLPLVEGELRGGRAHTWALQDTHGTRLYLKQQNAECQRLLERVAEPLAALAASRGGDLREELRAAWRVLLENHAHDSICGTSHDAVHREMMVRFARARAMALEAAGRALDLITGRDADAARAAGRRAWRPHVTVFNTVPRAARRLVEANVALFRRDIPVGPGSARRRAQAERAQPLMLKDARGRTVPYQLLDRGSGTDLVESPGHYPDCDEVEWHRVLFEAELPSLGVASFAATTSPRPAHRSPRTARPCRATATALANQHLQVNVSRDGTFILTDLETRQHFEGLGRIEGQHDAGDSYTSAPRGPIFARPDDVRVRVVHEGPLRAQLEVTRRYDAIALDVTMQLVLEAGSRAVGIWLEGMNLQSDFRLRMAFPARLRNARVVADAHFGAIERPAHHAPRATHPREAAAPTAPMQRWAAIARGERGLCVMTDGLPQYEIREGEMLVTVLRATGELSKPGLEERPGHAGWPTPTPEGQCIGPFSARLAVSPVTEAALDAPDELDRRADEFLVPPLAVMQRATLRAPRALAGPALVGAGLVMTAFKPAEQGGGVVLRCYNARRFEVAGLWRMPARVSRAALTRLDETIIRTLAAGRDIAVQAAPRATVTVQAR